MASALFIVFMVVCAAAAVRQSVPISPMAPNDPQGPVPPGTPDAAPAQGSLSAPCKCNSTGITSTRDYEVAARDQHNFYRAKHQSPPLEQNETLSIAAQQCAEYYAAKGTIDSTCPTKGSAGENQYATWYQAKQPSCITMANSASTFWYNAGEEYDYRQPGFSSKTGSFTALIWKSTKTLGIGCAARNGFAVLVALYSPAGNALSLGSDPNVYFRQNVLPPARPKRKVEEVQRSSVAYL